MPLKFNWRMLAVIAHDAFATGAAVLLSFLLRFDLQGLTTRETFLRAFLPLFLVYAAGVFSFFQLYRSKWRFASLPDLVNIFRASAVLTLSLLALDYLLASSQFSGSFVFGKVTLFLYFTLQMVALGGGRIAYRYYRYAQGRHADADSIPVLIAGNSAEADTILRAIESGAIRDLHPLGILSPAKSDQNQSIRLVRVLGLPRDLQNILADLEQNQLRPRRVILLPSMFDQGLSDEFLRTLRRHSLAAQHLPMLEQADLTSGSLKLRPLEIEDLLFRETVKIDYAQLRSFIRDKRIVVTGAAGSIGSEICSRVLRFGCSHLLMLDHAEAALFSTQEKIRLAETAADVSARLVDVRDKNRLENLLADFRPDYVFHAAALKHVPIVERDWEEGIATNVFGTVNLCQAAAKAGAAGVVIISTDKAVEPVSVLGLTKRFGEFYAAALDAEIKETRFISVRFGNVLGSSGSVVPVFKSQIAAGGPVTVTHPAMVRYFMTGREACDLVLTSACHAVNDSRRRAAVYVLDMGQPVRIIDLAERMIRLAGYVPHQDVRIGYSGIRPGERLHETLFAANEVAEDIGVAGISAASGPVVELPVLEAILRSVQTGLKEQNREGVLKILRDAANSQTPSAHLSLVKA